MLLTMVIPTPFKPFYPLPGPLMLLSLGVYLILELKIDFLFTLLSYILEIGLGCRGFARFVNIRDGKGATPLHLAARQKHPDCVHTLLDNGALVCASTGGYR